MNRNQYDLLILTKIEKSINQLLPLGAILSFFGALIVYNSGKSLILVIYDIMLAAVLMLVYQCRAHISPTFKIAFIASLILLLGAVSLLLTGLNGVGFMLMLLSGTLFIGFLSQKTGVFTTLGKLVFLTLLFILILNGTLEHQHPKDWLLPIALFGLSELVLIVVVNAIKIYLIENIHNTEQHLKKISQLAYYDAITGLPNKEKFFIAHDVETDSHGILLQFAVDGLSMVNSIYGSDEGDHVLRDISSYLKENAHDENAIARVGGSEFLWLFPSSDVKSVLEHYNELSKISKHAIQFYAGYIIDSYSKDHMQTLYKKTSIALEQARLHKNTVALPYNRESEKLFLKQKKIEELLSKAIHSKDFIMFYQEKVDSSTGDVIGVEALARWHSHELGDVSPCTFIPIVNQTKQTHEFDLMIVNLVMKDFPCITQKYAHALPVSINISPISLVSPSFIDSIINATQQHKINPNYIYFELTEDAFIENFDEAMKAIDRLRENGFKISIDDFGSGYSALNYIFRLKFDELKIDRSFIEHLTEDPKNIALLQAIINLKDTYGFTIIAEGVETQRQCELLNQLGCWHIQGYLYSIPSPITSQEEASKIPS